MVTHTSKTSLKPYGKKQSKSEEIEEMFDNISEKYDFLNNFFSLGINQLWARKAIKTLKKHRAKKVLDIACGSGDIALKIKQKIPNSEVFGGDISQKMLDIARLKAEKKQLQNIEFLKMNGESLPFDEKTFDAVTIAYGIRNYNDPVAGLKETHKVLKNGGMLIVLELTKPTNVLLRWCYNLYFNTFVPQIGKMISKDSSAYTYLPLSVKAFPAGNDFVLLMHEAGFAEAKFLPLTFGICTMYIGKK